MEFSGFSILPEEKILEVCQKLDDVALVKFMNTSKTHKRICGEILDNRNREYNTLIDEMISEVKRAVNERLISQTGGLIDRIHLYSPSDDYEFILFYGKPRYESQPEYLSLLEVHHKPLTIFQKLGLTESGPRYWAGGDHAPAMRLDETTMRSYLLKLFHYGHLTGEFALDQ